MIRNNLMSILIHFILSVAGYSLLFLNLRGYEVFLVAAIILLMYVAAGYFCGKPQRSRTQDLASVSSVSLILLAIAIACSLISLQPTQRLEWIIYAFANAPMIVVLFQSRSDNAFLICAYTFSWVPSLALWAGLYLKGKTMR